MNSSPRRRATRQRSGFTVSGQKSGSEARIVVSRAYQVVSPRLELHFEHAEAELPPQFQQGIGIAAIGGYIKLDKPAKLNYSVAVHEPLGEAQIAHHAASVNLPAGVWRKFGLHLEIGDPSPYNVVSLKGSLELEALEDLHLGEVQFFGVNLNTVLEYATETVGDRFGTNAYEDFKTQLYLYYPEIFYWYHELPFTVEPTNVLAQIKDIREGEKLFVKACNRCARFLPIDVVNERNALGFSNHCVQRAPCSHGAFSRFAVENWETVDLSADSLGSNVSVTGQNALVQVHFGFQLECRPCKKFHVNAPLNPARNAAQRREDSLRRRAFEALLRELLGIDWIFYKFRRQGQAIEFDTYIWEKFGRRCFGCGKPLPQTTDMALDHTLPLVYLWPLDETATCLCVTCNSQKHDKFPFEFEQYQAPGKLERLAEMTGISSELLLSRRKQVNQKAVQVLRDRIVWFFDEFLASEDYQKDREGKMAADLILASLQRILKECLGNVDLVQDYRKRTGTFPKTVTTAR